MLSCETDDEIIDGLKWRSDPLPTWAQTKVTNGDYSLASDVRLSQENRDLVNRNGFIWHWYITESYGIIELVMNTTASGEWYQVYWVSRD